jgi:hypothetical protein
MVSILLEFGAQATFDHALAARPHKAIARLLPKVDPHASYIASLVQGISREERGVRFGARKKKETGNEIQSKKNHHKTKRRMKERKMSTWGEVSLSSQSTTPASC